MNATERGERATNVRALLYRGFSRPAQLKSTAENILLSRPEPTAEGFRTIKTVKAPKRTLKKIPTATFFANVSRP